MMQARRWWYTAVLAVCVGGAMSAYGDPPPGPGAAPAVLQAYVKAQAEKMKGAATAEDAQTIRKETESFLVVKPGVAGPSPTEVDKYTHDVAAEFQGVIEAKPASYVSLNAVILLADINHINTDGALRAELSNANPAVRYWAARGLSTILPKLKPVTGAYQRAVSALITGVTTEKLPLVRAEMARALGATGDASLVNAAVGLSKALSNEAAAFGKGAPSGAEMNAAAAEMDAVADLLDAGMVLPKGDQTALLQGAADALSFAAQQATKANANGPMSGATEDLEKAAVRLFKAAAHGGAMPFGPLPAKAKNAELLFAVNDFTGSETGAGAVQKVFPEVKAPVRLP